MTTATIKLATTLVDLPEVETRTLVVEVTVKRAITKPLIYCSLVRIIFGICGNERRRFCLLAGLLVSLILFSTNKRRVAIV